MEYLRALEGASPWVALAVVVLVLWKSGLLKALSSRLQINGKSNHEKRLNALDDFQKEAEENHWHDIERLISKVDALEHAVNKNGNRLTRVETYLFNGKRE